MMPMMAPMILHDQKGYVALHFGHLDLRNAMVPLMMMLASYNTDSSANGIK